MAALWVTEVHTIVSCDYTYCVGLLDIVQLQGCEGILKATKLVHQCGFIYENLLIKTSMDRKMSASIKYS